MRAAGRSWRTSWQKTFCSRTRRAMSWAYWAPKSRTRMRSLSGSGVMAGGRLLVGELSRHVFLSGRGSFGAAVGLLVGEPGEQVVQRGFVLHRSGLHEPF